MRAIDAAILAIAALPSAFHFTTTSQSAVMRHTIDGRKFKAKEKKSHLIQKEKSRVEV